MVQAETAAAARMKDVLAEQQKIAKALDDVRLSQPRNDDSYFIVCLVSGFPTVHEEFILFVKRFVRFGTDECTPAFFVSSQPLIRFMSP